MTDLIALNDRLLARLRSHDFAGWDPFDMLNSRLFQATPLARSELARLALIQFGKRSPINFRALLGVPRRRNPKGIALIILGLLEDHGRTDEPELLDEAAGLADWLLGQQSDREIWQHACWGYHFDWQARAFFVPRGKPNIITTAYVGMALHALGEKLGRALYVERAVDAARFMSRHLFTVRGGEHFFAYIPGEGAYVHNANLWGAAWCAVAGRITGESRLVDEAVQAARCSVADQAPSGAWRYGTSRHHGFVDGFHTGYNLEALDKLATVLATDEFSSAIRAGYAYYKANFFAADGLPKYYDVGAYPLDMHSVSQAVITTIKVGGGPEDLALCDRIVNWAVANMYSARQSRFAYQKTRLWTNRIDYARWTQAWSYLALAFYNNHRARFG